MVRIAPGDHVVSVVEGCGNGAGGMTTNDGRTPDGEGEEDRLWVVMEIDGDGMLTFYHDCLHCRDLTCVQCVEVLENVAAFGRRYTRASMAGVPC